MTESITIGLARMHMEPGERRAFLPSFVADLEKHGAQVFLEEGYGSGMKFTEADYMKRAPKTRFVSHKEAYQERVAYHVNVTRALHELKLLMREMRASLPKVKVPALLIHSKDDDSVPPENMPKIYNALGSTEKEMKFVQGSTHVITEDGDRELVFEMTAEFIEQTIEEMNAKDTRRTA